MKFRRLLHAAATIACTTGAAAAVLRDNNHFMGLVLMIFATWALYKMPDQPQ